MNSKSVILPLHYRTHLTSESRVHKDMSVSVYTGTYIYMIIYMPVLFFFLYATSYSVQTHIYTKLVFFIITKAIKFNLQSLKYFQNLVSQII